MQKQVSTTLIITTYNWHEALYLVLQSIIHQTHLPSEIIIADDGSTQETKKLIELFQKRFSISLIHSYIEDKGFRVAKSRNIAIAKAKHPYIIIIDGDIVLHKNFIKDHFYNKQNGFFLIGSRCWLSPSQTTKAIKNKKIHIHPLKKGLSRPLSTLHIPWFRYLFPGPQIGIKRTRSANMSFWKKDFIDINGFEEKFVGYGGEDHEMIYRFYNLGLKRRNLRQMAICVHLWHNRRSTNTDNNIPLINNTLYTKSIKAQKGVDQYL